MGFVDRKILVIENFLPNLDRYLEEIYKIDLYHEEEYNKKFNCKQKWPGERSNLLNLESPFLFFLILQNLNKVDFIKKFSLELFLHFRGKEFLNKDWIHTDSYCDYSFLIYLNKDNFDSGTYIYDNNKKMIADIKYVQNRFVIFSADYNHMGYGHFGENKKEGRLTINGFLKTD